MRLSSREKVDGATRRHVGTAHTSVLRPFIETRPRRRTMGNAFEHIRSLRHAHSWWCAPTYTYNDTAHGRMLLALCSMDRAHIGLQAICAIEPIGHSRMRSRTTIVTALLQYNITKMRLHHRL